MLAATAACGTPSTPSPSAPRPAPAHRRATVDARRAADVRHGSGDRPAGVRGDICGSREARADHDASGGSRTGGVELAAIARAAPRAAHRSAQGRPRARRGAGDRLDAVAASTRTARPRATSSCAAAAARRRCRRAMPTSRSRRSPISRAGSNRSSSSSDRLTRIYLQRIDALDPKLRVGDHQDRRSRAGAARSRPTPRSPPGAIAARCTGFRTA